MNQKKEKKLMTIGDIPLMIPARIQAGTILSPPCAARWNDWNYAVVLCISKDRKTGSVLFINRDTTINIIQDISMRHSRLFWTTSPEIC